MKMNAGIIIGLIAGVIGLAAGIFAIIVTLGDSGLFIVAGMLVFFGGMFYLFYRIFFKHMVNARRLMKTGVDATATITAIRDTGVTINNSPLVKLILEVQNNFGQRYPAETRVLVSRLNPRMYQPGMKIPVKIDPNNEKNVVINSADQKDIGSILQPVSETRIAPELSMIELEKENERIRVSGNPHVQLSKVCSRLAYKHQEVLTGLNLSWKYYLK